MNFYHEWEARYRHDEMLRDVSRRQKWDQQAVGGGQSTGLLARLGGWLGAPHPVAEVEVAAPAAAATPIEAPRKAG